MSGEVRPVFKILFLYLTPRVPIDATGILFEDSLLNYFTEDQIKEHSNVKSGKTQMTTPDSISELMV